ncbi:MAG: hypothetical protein HOC70_13230 [Gammaproteobacteria bacterium]|jgi:hypothetical protein|nr:hypothetical protein [Gammaproteobacteria bacterium]MBT4494197.1 hypothetical protein [Gammaproteobacteria bacterium]MBT7370786.1 hypothetical protein [Gammaproteobacteria bacterium]
MIKTILFFILVVVSTEARSDQTIELHRTNDIADIELLDRELTQLVAKVRQCAAAGLAPASDCYCYYPTKLESTRVVYHQVLERHPEWLDRSVLWWDQSRSFTSNLRLRGLKQHIEEPCS